MNPSISIGPRRFLFPSLEGKTLLITGITSGIGRAMLPELLGQGLKIIAISRGLDEMEEVKRELEVEPERLLCYDCDLANPEAVKATAEALLASGLPVDAILHNAAIDPRHRFETSHDELWQQVMQVNLFAAVTLTERLLPRLRESRQGRILFTGSVMFDLGSACLSAYVASKGAVVGVMRSLAHELQGSGITVNAVIPGAIKVEKERGGRDETLLGWQSTPQRLGPGDLVAAICLLLSECGGAITGQELTIDGGIMHPLASATTQGRHLP